MLMAGSAFGAETLFSNYVYSVAPAGTNGKLWAFSQGDVYSGLTLLEFSVKGDNVQTLSTKQTTVSDSMTAVQTGIFNDDLAEHRRTPAVSAGKMGVAMPMFTFDDDGNYLQPAGFFSIRDIDNVIETPLAIPEAADNLDKPMQYAVSGFAYDSSVKKLWIARGALGFSIYDGSSGKGASISSYVLNVKNKSLDSLKKNYDLDLKNNAEIFDITQHPETGDMWFATAQGIWVKSGKKFSSISKALENSRVTGIWIGGEPLQIIAETSEKEKEKIAGGLWRLRTDKDKDFAKVDFLDTAGKAQKKDIYDEADYTVSSVAFLGDKAFVQVQAIGGTVSGYLKLDAKGARAWNDEQTNGNNWLYGSKTGATDRNLPITSICTFPLTESIMGLAIGTLGNGLSVSADSGMTWTTVLNRAKLGDNLGTVRMVPSVFAPGDPEGEFSELNKSLVSYKLSKESKVTIEVFSYDMRKVRTIVKDAVRQPDAARSTNPKEDIWDGRDDKGNECTMGVYYIRVKDNHGHIGWGKAMTLGGNRK